VSKIPAGNCWKNQAGCSGWLCSLKLFAALALKGQQTCPRAGWLAANAPVQAEPARQFEEMQAPARAIRPGAFTLAVGFKIRGQVAANGE